MTINLPTQCPACAFSIPRAAAGRCPSCRPQFVQALPDKLVRCRRCDAPIPLQRAAALTCVPTVVRSGLLGGA